MESLWFCLVAMMLAIYVALDGFDLGAGVVHLFVARNAEERGAVLGSIGPVWDGNEVWLIAGGGTLYFAFPALYAASFSGFYLPLMIVLWLLILRGIAIEFRHHIESPVWQPLWDVVFGCASALLTIFFGAALGNVVRGVPLDRDGYFFLALWGETGILDGYTLLAAATAFAALAMHGALWVALKTEGDLRMRSRRFAAGLWWVVLAAAIALTVASFRVQPNLARSFAERPWGWVFPLLATVGLMGARRRFLASCLFLVGMLASAAFGLYPYVLPSSGDPALGLTVYNAAAPAYGLWIGLIWFIPGMLLTTGYFVYTYRNFPSGTAPSGRGSV